MCYFQVQEITCKCLCTNLHGVWPCLEWGGHDPPEDCQLIHTVLKDCGNVDSICSTQHPCHWNDQNNLLVQGCKSQRKSSYKTSMNDVKNYFFSIIQYWNVLYIPFIKRILNSKIPLFCINSWEHKIGGADLIPYRIQKKKKQNLQFSHILCKYQYLAFN